MSMLAWDREKRNQIVAESPRTQKMREKLKKQLAAIDKKMTPQALSKKTAEIHQWIARHSTRRVTLKTKAISLFDHNQNAAKLSRKVAGLAEQLQVGLKSADDRSTTEFWNSKILSKN